MDNSVKYVRFADRGQSALVFLETDNDINNDSPKKARQNKQSLNQNNEMFWKK